MATKWIVARETNVQSSDRRLTPVWLFEEEVDARAWAQRLGRAAAMARSMQTLEEPWKGADHTQWQESALGALKGLDPDAVAGVRYQVCTVDDFVAPEEPAPANAMEAWWRIARDAG